MRRNGEPIDDYHRSRTLNVYDSTVNSAKEIMQTLTAVPPDDAWATYLWLDTTKRDGAALDWQRMQHDFIHASILEIEGKRQEAVAEFEKLRSELKRRGYNGRISSHVDSALKRLATP
jgi:hypothetical protein